MRRRFATAALAAGLVVSLLGAVPATAYAASAASLGTGPTLLSPANGSDAGSANPILAWASLSGAAKYRVQVSASPSFSSTLFASDTAGLHATPTNQLPTGTIYWRVAGMDADSALGPFSVASFFIDSGVAPSPISPTNGQTLNFPTDPTLFSWQSVEGATQYTIQVSNSSVFTTYTQYTTVATSFALTDTQSFTLSDGVTPQSFWWRVSATLGGAQATPFSTPRRYQILWNAKPTLASPANNAVNVTEVVFSWAPVLGAASYELQYSPNQDFQNNTVDVPTIDGTRYAPNPTLTNQSYYWRVRARATGSGQANNLGQWSDVWTFNRSWSTRPVTVSPHWLGGAHPAPTLANMELSWTPASSSGAGWVDHASEFEVWIGTDPNFSPNTGYIDCFTNHTTFTLYASETFLTPGISYNEPGSCSGNNPPRLTPGALYYWRVRGIDYPAGVVGLWDSTSASDLQRFIYLPTSPTSCGPTNGSTVSTPVLCWSSVSSAMYYHVTILKHDGSVAVATDTYATTYTPTSLTTSDGPFSWHVESRDANDAPSVQWAEPFPTFSLTTPTTDTSFALLGPGDGTSSIRPPSLSWTPYTGASYYQVDYGSSPYIFYATPLSGNDTWLSYSAFTYGDRGHMLATGTYYWAVQAFTVGHTLIATSAVRSFEVGVNTDGTDWVIPWNHYLTPECTSKTNPSGPSGRCVPTIGDTQELSWTPDPYAGAYEIEVAKDVNFTNIYRVYLTNQTTLTPRESWQDSQAGQSYYWFVRPCIDWQLNACGPDPTTSAGTQNASAYKKTSAKVGGLTTSSDDNPPVAGSTIADQVTFSWNDYITTSQAATYPVVGPPAAISTRVSQEAASYEITVSTDSNFGLSNLLENKTVTDVTQFTPWSHTYPEGPLYWKVQALDASGNELTASATGSVTKQSPRISPTTPAASSQVSGVPSFTWAPQNFAAKYNIEIYQNGDLNFSPSNRVGNASGTTYVAAWVPTSALPAGSYAWRVQRVDVGDNAGPWSVGRVFTLHPDAPTLVAPVDKAAVSLTDMLFTWSGPSNAVAYRFQTSTAADFSSTIDNQTTVMPAFAPTTPSFQYTSGPTYYWRVATLDSYPWGNILSTSAARSFTLGTVTPPPSNTKSTYHPITPVRLLDTRSGNGHSGRLSANTPITFQITGRQSIPAGVSAVTGNVTVTGSSAGWAVYLGPSPVASPTSSTINFVAGETAANGLTVALSGDGQLSATYMSNAGNSTDLVFDVTGYYTPDTSGDTYSPMSPVRLLDTRVGNGLSGKLYANTPRTFQITGRGGVPANAVAVSGNVTAVGSTAGWAAYVGPIATAAPTTSSVNFSMGQVRANNLTVSLGSGGKLSATYMGPAGASMDLVFDVTGYYTADATGASFVPLTPARLLDTRSGNGLSGKFTAGAPRTFTVASRGGVPSAASGVTGNVTVVGETAGWAIFVGPLPIAAPTTSTLNFILGDVKANGLTVALSGTGTLSATYLGPGGATTDLVFDVTGYFLH